MNPSRDEIKKWLKNNNKSREWLADKTFSSKGTVDNWLSKIEIPKAKLSLIENIMEDNKNTEIPNPNENIECSFIIKCTPEEFNQYSEAAKRKGMTINEFLIEAANKELNRSQLERPSQYVKSNRLYGRGSANDII